jgi:hypothetical protein
MEKQPQANRTRLNLVVDSTMFLAFLVATAPRFSGVAIHEWLGISFGAAIITHLLLHWQWIVAVTKRFLDATAWSARINYILNTLLFIDMTVIIFTGLMISKTVLPTLGITLTDSGAWHQIHTLSANLSLVFVGLHVALHWSWIANAIRRRVTRRAPNRQAAGALSSAQEA